MWNNCTAKDEKQKEWACKREKNPENIKTRPNMLIKTINVCDISSAIKQDLD